MTVTLVTSNKRKIEEATRAFNEFSVILDNAQVDIYEIQHRDPHVITRAKAESVYEVLKTPVVVNDAYWSIPALNGFPGGYMKDINSWFTSEDFLALMSGKKDRSAVLSDVVAYYDGDVYKTFVSIWRGHFAEEPKGKGSWSLDRVIRKDGDELTVAERWDRRDVGKSTNNDYYIGAWRACAQWAAGRQR